jgi:D-alanyl-lipoteichoic acid acyltransferase DltB (MBOAT superfamily)
MLFNSATFVVFLLLTLAAYWSTPWLVVRRWVLILASLIFYAWWDYRFVALLAYVTLVAYFAARAVQAWPGWGRRIVVLTLLLQLGQLAVFKYTNFLLATFGDLAQFAGSAYRPPKLDIILPVGISFYTFHGISYVVDVYRKKLERPQSLSIVALYVVFFPQLVAGPIVRADVFIPQALKRATLDSRDVITGLKLATIGLICKSVFADQLAPFVDAIFEAPARFDNWTLLSGALGFYSQIYFDFVGYSTMAIGFSRLFGFKLPRNFDFPYRAASITEFWRRWHISLSTWLRDYLYIPLGGNRHGTLAQYRNLLATMLLGGLWHGASYNFVLWGGMHGLALAAHKGFTTRFPAQATRPGARYLWLGASWLLTQAFVLAAWVPFRAQTLADAGTVLHAMSTLRVDEGLAAAAVPASLLIIPLATDLLLVQNPRLPAFPWPQRALWVVTLLGLSLAVILPLLSMKLQSFIYFQF